VTALLGWNVLIAVPAVVLYLASQASADLACFDTAPSCQPPSGISPLWLVAAFVVGNGMFFAVTRLLSRRSRRLGR
jgi:hypothetical protein